MVRVAVPGFGSHRRRSARRSARLVATAVAVAASRLQYGCAAMNPGILKIYMLKL